MRTRSIQSLIAIAVLAPTLAISAALVLVGDHAARQLSGEIGNRALDAAAQLVGQQLQSFLSDAQEVGDVLTRRVERGSLGSRDLDAWLAPSLDVMATNPRIAAITFGTADNDAFYVQRMVEGGLETCVARGSVSEDRQYPVSLDGTLAPQPNRVYDYLPSRRPWYIDATTRPSPRWTRIYTWFTNASTDATSGTAYVRVARDPSGEPAGVVCVDVTLGNLSSFLRSISPMKGSQLYIVDADGKLIAGSRGTVIAGDVSVHITESADSLTGSLGRAMRGAGMDLASAGEATLDVDGTAMHVHLAKLAPFEGIDWTMIAAVPEAELLHDARTTRLRSILLAGIVACGGAMMAFVTARRIARPIVDVQKHVARVASGDLDARLQAGGARELIKLSDGLNAMSADLKNRMQLVNSLRVASAVQQSLLPRSAPHCKRLDVYGASRYCDSTGGDYFDFIDTRDQCTRVDPDAPHAWEGHGRRPIVSLGDEPLLVAIGDVMGHGIGPAMLMANARGALHAALHDSADLRGALARVNRILLEANSGLFMTMTLLRICAVTGTVEWASAGHDSPILHDPADGSFRELDGAQMPLGLMTLDFKTYRTDGLRPGMLLFLGTDGVWETRDAAGDFFGKERVRSVIAEHATRSAREIGDALEAELAQFRGDAAVRDDVTFVIVRVLE